MGRRRCCCTSTGLCATYTIYGCGTGAGYELAGANVRIRASSGGAIVDSGVTDSLGRVTLCVPSAGARWLEADVPGRYANQGALTSTGSSPATLSINSVTAFGKCCLGNVARACTPPYIERGPLYLTDANGTWPPDGPGPCGFQWTTEAMAEAWVCSCFPTSRTTEVVPVRVVYQAGWNASGVLTVTRSWEETRPQPCSFGEDVSALAWLAEPVASLCLGTRNDPRPRSVGSTSASGGSCSSPVWSVSLTQTVGVAPDPVGGGVVISL